MHANQFWKEDINKLQIICLFLGVLGRVNSEVILRP